MTCVCQCVCAVITLLIHVAQFDNGLFTLVQDGDEARIQIIFHVFQILTGDATNTHEIASAIQKR